MVVLPLRGEAGSGSEPVPHVVEVFLARTSTSAGDAVAERVGGDVARVPTPPILVGVNFSVASAVVKTPARIRFSVSLYGRQRKGRQVRGVELEGKNRGSSSIVT